MGLNPTSDGARFRGRSGCVYPLDFGAHFDRSAEPPPAVVKVKYSAAGERIHAPLYELRRTQSGRTG